MFTKHASLEKAQVLGIKGSAGRVRTASLDKFSEFEDYRTEDGFLYARIRAISSRVNKNHDGWPSVELAGGSEAFNRIAGVKTGHVVLAADDEAKFGYSTFLGKPIFVDHHNSDPTKARGVIVDSKLHVEDHKTAGLDPYYASAPKNHTPPTWVELLLEVDAKSFPKLARAIIEGSEDNTKGIDGFSMGCDVRYSKCSHCGNKATAPDQYCEHVRMKGAEFPYTDHKTGKTTFKKSYEDCYEIGFFEISAVFDPADETALLREIRAHTAAGNPYDGPIYHGHTVNSAVPNEIDLEQYSNKPIHPVGSQVIIYDQANQRPISQGQVTMADPLTQQHSVKTDKGLVHDISYRRLVQAATRTAEAPPPQVDELKLPESVNTLREESICPVCGTDMDDDTCPVCEYQKPPDGFDNPDLTKANPDAQKPDEEAAPEEDETFGPPVPPTSNPPITSNVSSDMSWTVSTSRTSYTQPSKETPAVPNAAPATDEPKNATVKQDHAQPVTSSTQVRTAEDFLAAADQRRTMSQHTADAGSEAPEAATPDKSIDVDGVGGIMDASNESASKADAQIDVDGVGNTGPHDVSADKTESVDQGSETSKNIEGTPIKTFKDNGTNPVTNQVYPAEGGVTSSWQVEALDSEPYPHEDGGLSGGGANQGTEPVDPVGKPDERVDVLDATTSPANNSGDTSTWSGTDGNGVTKQVDPVTNETLEKDDIVNLSPGTTSSSHIFAAMKLADHEVALGLTPETEKYERAAELETLSPEELQAEARVISRVKTAGLSKGAARKTATRMPALGRSSSVEKEAKTETEQDPSAGDSGLFL